MFHKRWLIPPELNGVINEKATISILNINSEKDIAHSIEEWLKPYIQAYTYI
jgi:hypothetical protein